MEQSEHNWNQVEGAETQ